MEQEELKERCNDYHVRAFPCRLALQRVVLLCTSLVLHQPSRAQPSLSTCLGFQYDRDDRRSFFPTELMGAIPLSFEGRTWLMVASNWAWSPTKRFRSVTDSTARQSGPINSVVETEQRAWRTDQTLLLSILWHAKNARKPRPGSLYFAFGPQWSWTRYDGVSEVTSTITGERSQHTSMHGEGSWTARHCFGYQRRIARVPWHVELICTTGADRLLSSFGARFGLTLLGR